MWNQSFWSIIKRVKQKDQNQQYVLSLARRVTGALRWNDDNEYKMFYILNNQRQHKHIYIEPKVNWGSSKINCFNKQTNCIFNRVTTNLSNLKSTSSEHTNGFILWSRALQCILVVMILINTHWPILLHGVIIHGHIHIITTIIRMESWHANAQTFQYIFHRLLLLELVYWYVGEHVFPTYLLTLWA